MSAVCTHNKLKKQEQRHETGARRPARSTCRLERCLAPWPGLQRNTDHVMAVHRQSLIIGQAADSAARRHRPAGIPPWQALYDALLLSHSTLWILRLSVAVGQKGCRLSCSIGKWWRSSAAVAAGIWRSCSAVMAASLRSVRHSRIFSAKFFPPLVEPSSTTTIEPDHGGMPVLRAGRWAAATA